MAKPLKYLTPLLKSDESLQILSIGDRSIILLQLDSPVQLSFSVDSKALSYRSLTIADIDDLRLNCLSTITSSDQEQRWKEIQRFFHELIQYSKSDNSLYLIVRLVQEHLSEIHPIRHTLLNYFVNDVRIQSKSLIPSTSIQNHAVNEVSSPIDRKTESTDELMQSSFREPFVEGLHRFDRSTRQWVLLPHLSLLDDDLTQPSNDQMCLPNRCQLITWNIRTDHEIDLDQRDDEIFQILQRSSSDVICLQEVSHRFLSHLLDDSSIQQNDISLIISKDVLESSGQIMLMKNVQPRAFDICPVESQVQDPSSSFIVARFGLTSSVTIDLVNLHLPKTNIDNDDDQQWKILQDFFQAMFQTNYLLIGDFNLTDVFFDQSTPLEKHRVHDLWKEHYNLDEDPGFTIDTSRNPTARMRWKKLIRSRSDRFFFHTVFNLDYSIEHLQMVGEDVNLSDHYALQVKIEFRPRMTSDRSILAIVLPRDQCSTFELSNQLIPHLKLISPFFDLHEQLNDDDVEKVLLPLRFLLSQYESFELEMIETQLWTSDGLVHIKYRSESNEILQQFKEQIQQLFPSVKFDHQHVDPMKIVQQQDEQSRKSIKLSVRYVSILRQTKSNETTTFHIASQIPLGSALDFIGVHPSDGVDTKVQTFFTKMNFYNKQQSYEQKKDKVRCLSQMFDEVFHSNVTNCFAQILSPYGSFRLGLDGDDLDLVLILFERKSSAKDRTKLDQDLLQLKYDSFALNGYFVRLINERLNKEIIHCYHISAVYPIISILFNDQTRVELSVQLISGDSNEKIRLTADRSIHGIHDIDRLIVYVRYPVIFQHFLTFIRQWAQLTGIYGQVFGYLGGFTWAVLCASICRSTLSSSFCSWTEFNSLIERFFSTYSQFDWSSRFVGLSSKSSSESFYQGSMQILCPSYPYVNSARSTTRSAVQIIVETLQNAFGLLKTNSLATLLRPIDSFPHRNVQSIIELTISSDTFSELYQWIGWIKSRLARFLRHCEDECHLFVQTSSFLQNKTSDLERFYSIGFSLSVETLSRNRSFSQYFHLFLDHIRSCPYRTSSMKVVYHLMSVDQWRSNGS